MEETRKVVIITGANSGIGKMTTQKLLQKGGYHIIMACRNETSTRIAIEVIKSNLKKQEIDITDDMVEYMPLDLSSLESVRSFALNFKSRNLPLHVLINNAGVTGDGSVSNDGFEIAFGTNHLGHFLLTNLLLDVLKASAPSRVVVVTSSTHHPNLGGPGPFFTFDVEEMKKANTLLAYKNSKLANIWFTYELARRLGSDPSHMGIKPNTNPPFAVPDSGIIVTCLCPGLNTSTNLARNTFPAFRWIFGLAAPYIFPEEVRDIDSQGEDVAWVATQTEVDINGMYVKFKNIEQSSEESRNGEKWKQLWEASVNWTGLEE